MKKTILFSALALIFAFGFNTNSFAQKDGSDGIVKGKPGAQQVEVVLVAKMNKAGGILYLNAKTGEKYDIQNEGFNNNVRKAFGPGDAHFGSITIRARLVIREGGRTVGAGQVTEIIE